jgi:Stigma-specific protein, Stig1
VPSWELCLASFPGVALANDDCRSLGRECRRDSQCCSGNCVRRGDDKVCACPTGRTRCNDRCVNLQRNERHCGRCGNRCAEGQECVNGVCGQACLSTGGSCTTDSECCSGNCTGGVCQECPRTCSPRNCGTGTLNQNTCTCECSPQGVGQCAQNLLPEAQGCCPTATGFSCVPVGTVCSPA